MREERDPIELVRRRLLEAKQAKEDELKEMDSDIRAVINQAAEFAQSEPEPDAAELWTDVYLEEETVAVREG